MPGRIPRGFIDDLLARADIVDVIDSYVPLRKAGKDYQACCPFHQEKTPSFTVSRDKQFYYCFGCGASGNTLSFLMDYNRLEFVEAVEELAARQGLAVPYEIDSNAAAQQHQRGSDLYEVLAVAADFYQQQLQQHPQAEPARTYLSRRGLSAELIAQFGIGFAPPGWDNLLRYLQTRGFAAERLAEAGLLSQREQGGYYDRFRERVMFPIQDQRGRVIAFGGRVLDKGEPKYLNSPETPVFQKRRELYGWYLARKLRPSPQRVVVVEGYMDVVALAQYGIQNTVATLGTATGEEHLQRLFRSLSEVVFCFDGDNAGRKAAWRALETALPLLEAGRQINFMFLPEGEDPDSLVRSQGQAAFLALLEQAQPLSDFLFQQLGTQVKLNSLDGRARLVELARPLLAKLPNGPYQELMLQELSRRSGVSQSGLEHMLPLVETQPRRAPRMTPKTGQVAPSPMRTAIALLLRNPGLAQGVDVNLLPADLDLPGSALLRELLELLWGKPHLDTAIILEQWRGREEEKILYKLLSRYPEIPEEGSAAEFHDAIQHLYQQHREQRLEKLLQKARFGIQSLTPEEKQSLQELTRRPVRS